MENKIIIIHKFSSLKSSGEISLTIELFKLWKPSSI